jgi:hypothetical protein
MREGTSPRDATLSTVNRRAGRRAAQDDEPVLDEEEPECCRDDLICVVDRTAAGFALGPTVTQMRRARAPSSPEGT